ncbi:MAG: hypothetical protein U1F43_24430 [Myxococcota bacterium]
MPSSRGTSDARDRLPWRLSLATALLAGLAALCPPRPAAAQVGFDAIFYRARAAFDFCYSFDGTAGWSLRTILGGRITHASLTPCPRDGLTPSQLAATLDCGPECHADCASFVRRAWVAGTDQALTPLEAPSGGNCADPSDYGGERFVRADQSATTVDTQLADARPGDWCSHADHVLMLVRRSSPESDRWITWEANSSPVGIGQGSVDLNLAWLRSIPRDDCHWTDGLKNRPGAWKNSGCWHPPAVRTGPPVDVELVAGGATVAQDGVVASDALSDGRLRFARPDGFPALGDYLLWFRWRSGGSDEAPVWEHRLVRVPAFSRRGTPAERLAVFPDAPEGGIPLDLDQSRVIEVPLTALAAAPSSTPGQYKNTDSGVIAEAWTLGAGMAPVPPTRFVKTGVPFAAGTSYAWRVRVERYGELGADGTRRQVVWPCATDAGGKEQIEYCKDPRWSDEQRFTVVCGEDDSCRVGVPVAGEVCVDAPERHEDTWTSGCAQVSVAPAEVHAGDTLTVSVTTHSGLCAGSSLWVVPADWADLGGTHYEASSVDLGIYDFCYSGTEQPVPISGPATQVPLADEWTGTVTFHIPSALSGPACIDYVGPDSGGVCCTYGGGCTPRGMFRGPMAAVGGGGGTHGWTTVRMFGVVPPGIAPDPSHP